MVARFLLLVSFFLSLLVCPRLSVASYAIDIARLVPLFLICSPSFPVFRLGFFSSLFIFLLPLFLLSLPSALPPSLSSLPPSLSLYSFPIPTPLSPDLLLILGLISLHLTPLSPRPHFPPRSARSIGGGGGVRSGSTAIRFRGNMCICVRPLGLPRVAWARAGGALVLNCCLYDNCYHHCYYLMFVSYEKDPFVSVYIFMILLCLTIVIIITTTIMITIMFTVYFSLLFLPRHVFVCVTQPQVPSRNRSLRSRVIHPGEAGASAGN